MFPAHKDTARADPATGCHGWVSGWPLKCPQSRFSALALPFRLLGEAWAPLLPASPRRTAEPGCLGPARAGVVPQLLQQQQGSAGSFPEPTRGNVCSVSRQPQLLSLPPLQGRGVMRTCITLLGSDRALRNPRSSAAGAGGGCEGTPLLPAGARPPLPLSRAGRHRLRHGRGAGTGNFGVVQGAGRDVVQRGSAPVPLLSATKPGW